GFHARVPGTPSQARRASVRPERAPRRSLSVLPVGRGLAARHRRRISEGRRRGAPDPERGAARGHRDPRAGIPDRRCDRVREPGAPGRRARSRGVAPRAPPMGLALEARDVVLSYRQPAGTPPVVALALPHFAVGAGDVVGVTGPSGSGKTSLLAVLAAIERPDTGRVAWGDQDVTALSEAGRDRWRQRRVGFVFQEFNLL